MNSQQVKKIVLDVIQKEFLTKAKDSIPEKIIKQIAKEKGDINFQDLKVVVRLLDEVGYFCLRGSVEALAKHFGCTRQTIYNYLYQ